jgi:hypothetical protein
MYLTCGKESLIATLDSDSPVALSPAGTEVNVVFDMQKTHLFDKETEEALN